MNKSNEYDSDNSNEINQKMNNNTLNHGGMAVGSSNNIYIAEGEIVRICSIKDKCGKI